MGPKSYSLSCNAGSVTERCLASMVFGLEAFNRYPTDGSFAVLAFQPTPRPTRQPRGNHGHRSAGLPRHWQGEGLPFPGRKNAAE
jgi:hypothetical protein